MRCLAVVLLCLASVPAEASPSPYLPVTQFNGDRYSAHTQMGPDVVRAVKAKTGAKPRDLYPTRKRPPVSRKQMRDVPIPVPRPLAYEPYRVEAPISIGEGVWRETRRAVGRPRAWCGWWLGRHLGMPDRRLWLARNWATVGSRAAGPAPGIIVVWRHHVGTVTAVAGNRIRVLSGNDGRAVRDRWRSTAGVIAYRSPS